MKRFLALLIVAVMLLLFCACGNNKELPTGSCWNCGKTISETAAFCANCGSAVADNPNNTGSSTTESTNTTDGTEDSTGGDTADLPTTLPTSTPHTHSYSSKVTTAASCGKDGVKTFSCSCGSSYTEKITATGQHAWNSATCTTPKTCTTCSKTEGSVAGHSWGTWTTVTAAEVGKAGQEKRTCSSCKLSETREIPALQEDLTQKWFANQYSIAEQQYINSLNSTIFSKNNEISTLRGQASASYSEYQREIIRIKNQCANSGMSNTGYESKLLKNAENNYTANAKTYTNQINSLENEIAAIKVEIANPNVDNILAIVTKNCNITSMETYEYYYKYSDSLS